MIFKLSSYLFIIFPKYFLGSNVISYSLPSLSSVIPKFQMSLLSSSSPVAFPIP